MNFELDLVYYKNSIYLFSNSLEHGSIKFTALKNSYLLQLKKKNFTILLQKRWFYMSLNHNSGRYILEQQIREILIVPTPLNNHNNGLVEKIKCLW